MAKSKQQKRDEALTRSKDHFDIHTLPSWIRASDSATPYYDAAHALFMYNCTVKSAYAAHLDIHGNYLDQRYYRANGCWNFVSSDKNRELALHNQLYSLEELKQLKDRSGATLYKLAYGTSPFVAKPTDPYNVAKAGEILGFMSSFAILQGANDIFPNINRGVKYIADTAKLTAEINKMLDPANNDIDGNRTAIVMAPLGENQEVIDLLSGKISMHEALSIEATRETKQPSWNGSNKIDIDAVTAFRHGTISVEQYIKIRTRAENGMSDEECAQILTKQTN